MYIFFVLNHPAHYHLFKNSIRELSKKNHQCEIFIRPKDVLKSLLDEDLVDYNILSERKQNRRKIFLSSILGLIKKDFQLAKYVQNKKPDIMIGTDWAITNIGKIFNVPSIVLNEDDTEATPENKIFYPLATTLLLPDCCDKGMWNKKKISYAGYHELAYLHPNRFIFDKNILKSKIVEEKPYIIVRLVKLTASHDIGKRGLGQELIIEIINIARNQYEIYISFEDEIIPGFEMYAYSFNPGLMHQFLAGANLVIGDSQTMIAEAAVLGTPSIRFNDFVGKLGYLDELENKYELSFGYKTNEKDRFLLKVEEILKDRKIKKQWDIKVKAMLSDKIDVTAFM
ncbi:MAG: DUF354 domain-containing protein, partial [Chloroflexi bacterium]|nr:DUF354 domain-containing protein [Chloroflexota bacterium]